VIVVGRSIVPRTTGVRDGRPVLSDGRSLDVTNIVWSTGYRPGFSWIDLPVFGTDGELDQRGGFTRDPGLFFVGLHFLYAFSSTMIRGVGRDAKRIVDAIASRPEGAAVSERGMAEVA
jgi:putative flavoprotein involved in K+ transport